MGKYIWNFVKGTFISFITGSWSIWVVIWLALFHYYSIRIPFYIMADDILVTTSSAIKLEERLYHTNDTPLRTFENAYVSGPGCEYCPSLDAIELNEDITIRVANNPKVEIVYLYDKNKTISRDDECPAIDYLDWIQAPNGVYIKMNESYGIYVSLYDEMINMNVVLSGSDINEEYLNFEEFLLTFGTNISDEYLKINDEKYILEMQSQGIEEYLSVEEANKKIDEGYQAYIDFARKTRIFTLLKNSILILMSFIILYFTGYKIILNVIKWLNDEQRKKQDKNLVMISCILGIIVFITIFYEFLIILF